MTAIVCVDEAWGMAFHGRRQSRDRAVCARILEDAAGRRLWMSRDTLRLFEAPYPEYLTAAEDFLAQAGPGELCFVEEPPLLPWLDRLEEVTDIPKMDTSSEKLVVSHYDISLEHISFGYGGRQVIHDISLEIPEHTTCAIVGPSGSGKTTLCNLIARFWDVQEGTVRIGGKNVRDYTADSVLEYISMVFQNVYLFHDSVENNIRFGRPEATREQVIAAAKRACCHDFILSLPDGYDTIIGEGGSTLSGGEKQRISIARAILKDAPIIILDEATSSVDPENEQALLSAIQELTKDKTLISIAHRLSTVRNADQIIVIDQGRIVQRGTHHELLQKEGIYQRFLTLRTAATGWQL